MMIIKCPKCGTTLEIPEKLAGTTGICKNCKTQFTAPIAEFKTATTPQKTEQTNSVKKGFGQGCGLGCGLLTTIAIALLILIGIIAALIAPALMEAREKTKERSQQQQKK